MTLTASYRKVLHPRPIFVMIGAQLGQNRLQAIEVFESSDGHVYCRKKTVSMYFDGWMLSNISFRIEIFGEAPDALDCRVSRE